MFKCFADIFTDDTDAEQLHTAKEQDQYNDRGITRDIDALYELLQNDDYQIDHRGYGCQTAQKGCDAQRLSRITDNAFDRVIEKLEEDLPKAPNKDEYRELTDKRSKKRVILVKDIQKWFAIFLMLVFMANILIDFANSIFAKLLSI